MGLIPADPRHPEGETDLVANLANVAALKEQFGWLWIGFYLVRNEELIVGPFRGLLPVPGSARARGYAEPVGLMHAR